MISLKWRHAVTASILLLTINPTVWAKPILFEFTGTVTDSVIDAVFGELVTEPLEHPEWVGQQVFGTVTMDLEGQWEYFDDDDPYKIFKSHGSVADSNWMQVKLRNPDGTYFDSSLATYGPSIPFDPLPNTAYAQLTHMSNFTPGVPSSNFQVVRRYHDSESFRRYNYIELTLSGNGDNAHLLTNSKNYEDAIIKPEFANVRNFGAVKQSNRTLTSPNYYFNIDSFTRISTNVPEPSAPLLLFSGLLIVLVKRYKYLVK
ncbi:MAG: hypothetical protein EOP48_31055 [Sphingobacteriales bacterium]|nr:MAG: hypothetical protein EOP48_31055 [Sphingobacteriales bacterium]